MITFKNNVYKQLKFPSLHNKSFKVKASVPEKSTS